MEQITVISTSPEELFEMIRKIVREELDREKPGTELPEMITRSDVARLLKVSMMTVDRYSRLGFLHRTKIGTRVLYEKELVLKAMSEYRFKGQSYAR